MDRPKQHDPPPSYAPPTRVPFETQLAQQTEQGEILAAKLAGRVAHKPVSISPSPETARPSTPHDPSPGVHMQAVDVHDELRIQRTLEEAKAKREPSPPQAPASGIQDRDGPGYLRAGKVHRKRALEEDVEVGVDEPTTDPKSPKRNGMPNGRRRIVYSRS